MVGGVSVAGFLPGFGRGGMTHSLLVIEVLDSWGSSVTVELAVPGCGSPPLAEGLIARGWLGTAPGVIAVGDNDEAGEEAAESGAMATLACRGGGASAMAEGVGMMVCEDAVDGGCQ